MMRPETNEIYAYKAKSVLKKMTKYKYISAILAFGLWGGWAYFVNQVPEQSIRSLYGLTQGTISFIMTLFMVHIVAWVFKRSSTKGLQLLLPALVAMGFSGSVLVLIHSFIGTPHLIFTITPALFVGFIFSLLTSYKLYRERYE